MSSSWTIYCVCLLCIGQAVCLSLKNCRSPMGMQSGEIPDEALSASSTFDIDTVGPRYSRIRTETNGGAWCPKSQIDANVYEYLEINLSNLTVITAVETQGRFGNGLGQEYAEYYMLEYKREDDKAWIRYKNRQGEMVLNGNANTYIAEMRDISPPILAKRLRFIPFSKTKRTVCLRVEIYGCSFQDDIVWYQMPQGDRRNDIELVDNAYDGIAMDNSNNLKDGLGQLTDGELGDDDFRSETFYFGMKGYEWVGWRRNSERSLLYRPMSNHTATTRNSTEPGQNLAYIPLAFKFDHLRNFTSVSIHCNNMFSKDVQHFNKAVVQFSSNGFFSSKQQQQPKSQLVFDIPSDLYNETARFIKLELGNFIGRYVRIKLYFASKWLLISELNFNSFPMNNDNKQEITEFKSLVQKHAPKLIAKSKAQNEHTSTATTTTTPVSTQMSPFKQYYVIILVITILILISIFGLIVAVILLNKQKYKNKSVKLQNIIHQKQIYGDGLYTTNLPLSSELANFLKLQQQQQQAKYLLKPLNSAVLVKADAAFSTATTSLSSSSRCGSDKQQLQQQQQMYHLLQQQQHNSDNDSREYCSPDLPTLEKIKFFHSLNRQHAFINDDTTNTTPYASVDIVLEQHGSSIATIESIQGVCGNVVFHVENKQEFLTAFPVNESLKKVSTITFLNQLTDGQFGKMYTVSLTSEEDAKETLLAKVLVNQSNNNETNNSQQSFLEEFAIRSRLNHPNLANMIAYCDNPYCLVSEYKSDLGHLDEYLLSESDSTINYSTQLYILLKISSAMKYLEQLSITHRDLSIRNCLVYSSATPPQRANTNIKSIDIKITDIAICLQQYHKDYYFFNNSKLLPIRYMPAEAVFDGLYSPASDVWSFGLLIWQLFANSSHVPFSEWSNTDYLYNLKLSTLNKTSPPLSDDLNRPLLPHSTATLHHQQPQKQRYSSAYASLKPARLRGANSSFIECCLNMASTPFNCSKEIHDLLIECCNANMLKRPKFNDIYLFLQCKLFGSKF